MNTRSATSLFAAACVAAASAAHALPLSDRASFELFAGGNAAMPGSYRGALNVEGPDGPAYYNRLDFKDMYSQGYTGGAEFDYAFDSHLTGFARAAYSQLSGENQKVGSFFSNDNGVIAKNARFGDTNSRELDLGARYNFATGEKWHPFVGAALGVVRQSGATVDVENPDGAGNTRVELGLPSTVFEQRIETGLQFSPMRNFDLRLTAAASHLDGGKRSDDPNLALLGLDSSQGAVREHWDYPAELGAVWHF